MNAQEMSHIYGYIRASTDKQIASPETQRQIIEEYARRIGRTVDHCFVDPATSGKKALFERDAGKELSLTLKKGDEVIVARLDRLSRSFVGAEPDPQQSTARSATKAVKRKWPDRAFPRGRRTLGASRGICPSALEDEPSSGTGGHVGLSIRTSRKCISHAYDREPGRGCQGAGSPSS
jgi:Resolvase, N terminal domain